MSLYRHPKSAYWWVRFTIGGREVRQSSGTKERKAAEEYEHKLRARYWRVVRLGETHHTWKEARERWIRERAAKRSLKRDKQIFAEYAELDAVGLREIDEDALRSVREAREKVVTVATVNREFALLRAVLRRAVTQWKWLDHAPVVPMAALEQADPRWLTRVQFDALLKHLPEHLQHVARFAVATGLRKSNITGLLWEHVDVKSKHAFVAGSAAKGKRGISVPLNADALAVIRERIGKHDTHVFSRGKMPLKDLVQKRWRAACIAAGVPGLRFHDLRHTWASWMAQAGTPAYALRELGGWRSEAMVRRYSHLGPSDLAQYAAGSLRGGMRNGTPAKGKARKAK